MTDITGLMKFTDQVCWVNSDERVTLAADFHFCLEVIVRQKLSARPLARELFIKC